MWELASVFQTNYSNYNTLAMTNEQKIFRLCCGRFIYEQAGLTGRTIPAQINT